MTAAYLTERETTRKLCLPDKIGRLAMAMWKMQSSVPKPAEGMGGRWFWLEVEQWLLTQHGVGGHDHAFATGCRFALSMPSRFHLAACRTQGRPPILRPSRWS
jgi:hypothetical protein